MQDPTEVDHETEPPGRSSGLTFLALLVGVLIVAFVLGVLMDPGSPTRPPSAVVHTNTSKDLTTAVPDQPIGVQSPKDCPVPMGALALGDPANERGSALDVWNCDAWTQGPWSLVIRASDGHFGLKSAVVTFPISPPAGIFPPTQREQFPYPPPVSGVGVTKPPGGRWYAEGHLLTWPLGGSDAGITGDVGKAQLTDLATRITIADGRPSFSHLDGFTAEDATTFGIADIHVMEYQSADLGLTSKLGDGRVRTGRLTSGALLENGIFMRGAKPAGLVRGKPAIYCRDLYPEWLSFGPDIGTLAWESGPGEVTYIGFSGSAKETEAIETLRTLAEEGTWLTSGQWLKRKRTQIYP